MPTRERLLACWAKLNSGNGRPGYHPLLCHMADIAMVAKEMWESTFSPAQQTAMAEALGLGECRDAAGLWCALLALTRVCINLWTWKANGFLGPLRY